MCKRLRERMGAWAKGRKGGEGNKRGRGGERAGERIKWKVETVERLVEIQPQISNAIQSSIFKIQKGFPSASSASSAFQNIALIVTGLYPELDLPCDAAFQWPRCASARDRICRFCSKRGVPRDLRFYPVKPCEPCG